MSTTITALADRGPRPGSAPAHPVTLAQADWYREWIATGGAGNLSATLHLDGPLSIAALDRALRTAVGRHDALRTSFITVDGELRQVVGDAIPALEIIDLRAADRDTAETAVRRRGVDEQARRFDLHAGELARYALYRITDTDHRLVLSTHHAVCDGYSVHAFLADVAASYRDQVGDVASVRPRPTQLAEFARAENQRRADPDQVSATLAHWAEALRGDDSTLRSGPEAPRRLVDVPLSAATVTAAADLAARHRLGITGVLLGAFASMLHVLRGTRDVVAVLPFANRDDETRATVGQMANPGLIRVAIDTGAPAIDLLRQSHAAVRSSSQHAWLPMQVVEERLGVDRLDYPWLNVLRVETPTMAGLSTRIELMPFQRVRQPLLLVVWLEDGAARAALYHHEGVVPTAAIDWIAASFDPIVRALCATPEAPLAACLDHVAGPGLHP